jgi:predicted metal-dependent hydrolase
MPARNPTPAAADALAADGDPQPLRQHPDANRHIVLHGQPVAYACRRSAHRRTIGLSIGPQGLSVVAPQTAPWSAIEAVLQRKAAWVLRHLRQQAERPASPWPEPTPALLAQARAMLAERVAYYSPQLGVQPARLRLSTARTRWGSASSRGTIALNWRLVLLPPALCDYVVVHELAHLREMNHGPAFWALVRAVLPDVEQRRAALRRIPLV